MAARNLRRKTPQKSKRGLEPKKVSNEKKESFLDNFYYRDDKGAIQIRLGRSLPGVKALSIFSKQFSIMIERGIPLTQALQILGEQEKLWDFRNIIFEVKTDIENGATLSASIQKHRRVFDNLYVAMIRAGEVSGSLDVILRQLVLYIEKNAKLQAQVTKAMIYPSFIVIAAVGVITMLLIFVVPSFADQFASSGQELPELTQYVLAASEILQKKWWQLIGVLVVAIFGFGAWRQTDNGAKTVDAFLLKAPIVGNVLQKIAIGRFCGTMATMLNSGVSILEALTICATSSGNKMIEEFVYEVREDIAKGTTFAEPLGRTSLFPPMVVSMVAIGEQTGALDETLGKIAEIYDEQVENAVAGMISMIEPILLVVIGAAVAVIMLAMYLPIFEMAGTVG